MLRYLVPRIAFRDLGPMFGIALLGAALAGAYGVVHDEITYSLSAEYFTNLKFPQFRYADLGLGNRVFVATIGFLAVWWVGFVAAWFLGRRFLPNQPRRLAYRQIAAGFACVFLSALTCGMLGFAYGLWRGPQADYSDWSWAFEQFNVKDHYSFVRVTYIHNAGYLGGAIGLIVALVAIRPTK